MVPACLHQLFPISGLWDSPRCVANTQQADEIKIQHISFHLLILFLTQMIKHTYYATEQLSILATIQKQWLEHMCINTIITVFLHLSRNNSSCKYSKHTETLASFLACFYAFTSFFKENVRYSVWTWFPRF